MSKIILDDDSTNLDPLVINENFRKIEKEFNEKVLYRDSPEGEPNEMENDLDMNGNRIYNLPKPVEGHEPLRLSDIGFLPEEIKEYAEESKEWAEKSQDAYEHTLEALAAGSVYIGDYGPGLVIEEYTNFFGRDGIWWRPSPDLELPYTTTGDWGDEEGLFVAVGDASLRADLIDPNKGAGIIGYLPSIGSVRRPRTVGSRLSELSATPFDVVSGPSEIIPAEYLNELLSERGVLKLPHGYTWKIDGDILVPNFGSIVGEGTESVLEFSNGGVVCPGGDPIPNYATLSDFSVKLVGDNLTGISLVGSDEYYGPVRWFMHNIKVESDVLRPTNTGIRVSGGWIGTMVNPIARLCGDGLKIERDSFGAGVSFNQLAVFGGEFQGNNRGVDVSQALGLKFFGTAIEGNRQNGALLRTGTRGVLFSGVYFEANGIDGPTTGNDIRIFGDEPSSTLYGVSVDNCTFLRGGVGGENAIFVNRCAGLNINETCSFNGYENTIVADELASGLITGSFLSQAPGHNLPMINDTRLFGTPVEKSATIPGGYEFPDSTIRDFDYLALDVPNTAANFCELGLIVECESGQSGNVLFQISITDSETGELIATNSPYVSPVSYRFNNVKLSLFAAFENSKGKKILIRIRRNGSSSSDTLVGPIKLHSIKASFCVGRNSERIPSL